MTLTGSFRITEISGAPASGGYEIEFSADGRLHGRVVNRFSGTAEQSADTVTFGAIAATRMAGPPALMAEEDAVFRVLSGTVEIDQEFDDVLLTGEGGTLRLARTLPGTDASLV